MQGALGLFREQTDTARGTCLGARSQQDVVREKTIVNNRHGFHPKRGGGGTFHPSTVVPQSRAETNSSGPTTTRESFIRVLHLMSTRRPPPDLSRTLNYRHAGQGTGQTETGRALVQ